MVAAHAKELEQMSALTDVSVSFDPIGRATIRGGSGSGPVLVDGNNAATVTYASNGAGAVSLTPAAQPAPRHSEPWALQVRRSPQD